MFIDAQGPEFRWREQEFLQFGCCRSNIAGEAHPVHLLRISKCVPEKRSNIHPTQPLIRFVLMFRLIFRNINGFIKRQWRQDGELLTSCENIKLVWSSDCDIIDARQNYLCILPLLLSLLAWPTVIEVGKLLVKKTVRSLPSSFRPLPSVSSSTLVSDDCFASWSAIVLNDSCVLCLDNSNDATFVLPTNPCVLLDWTWLLPELGVKTDINFYAVACFCPA